MVLRHWEAMAELMTVEVPDQRDLLQNSDRIFPMLKVIQFIDGRIGVRGHGSKMLAWGSQLKAEVLD